MEPIITVLENKLTFSNEALKLLQITAGDRLTVNYVQISSTYTFPIIGKSEYCTNKEDGNKLTKSNTLSFRGVQNKVLQLYGTEFKLELYKEGLYKMIPIKNN